MHLRGGLPAELDRVADQVLEQLDQLHRIPRDGGERCMRHYGAAFLNRQLQVPHGMLQDSLAVNRCKRTATGSDTGIGQQVADQPLHAVGTVHGKRDEFLGVAVQPVPVALRQQLREACHFSQRFLEIMGGDIGKLLQLPVGSLQFGCRLLQCRHRPCTVLHLPGQLRIGPLQLGGPLLHQRLEMEAIVLQLLLCLPEPGDIPEYQDDADDGSAGVANRGPAIRNTAFGSVPADQGGMIRQPDDDAGLENLLDGVDTGLAGLLVDDTEYAREVHPHGLLLRPAGELLGDGVHQDDITARVCRDHAVADRAQRHPQAFLLGGQLLFGHLPFGDVLDNGLDDPVPGAWIGNEKRIMNDPPVLTLQGLEVILESANLAAFFQRVPDGSFLVGVDEHILEEPARQVLRLPVQVENIHKPLIGQQDSPVVECVTVHAVPCEFHEPPVKILHMTLLPLPPAALHSRRLRPR